MILLLSFSIYSFEIFINKAIIPAAKHEKAVNKIVDEAEKYAIKPPANAGPNIVKIEFVTSTKELASINNSFFTIEGIDASNIVIKGIAAKKFPTIKHFFLSQKSAKPPPNSVENVSKYSFV